MISSRSKGKPSSPGGGSRLFVYLVAFIFVIIVAYYVVVPLLTPKPVRGPAIFLSPSTDISGASGTISGQNLSANRPVTAMFRNIKLNLTGNCQTTSSGALAGCQFWVPNLRSGSYNVTVNDGTKTLSARFTIPQYTPPVSTIFVSLTAFGLMLATQLVTRRVVNLDSERRMKAEVNAFRKEKNQATLANDKVKLEKLKKRELQVNQEQMKIQRARLKVTGITIAPFFLVYYLMATFLGGYGVIVGFTSIPIPYLAGATQNPTIYNVSLFWWYFLSSTIFSITLSRLLHTTT